MPRYKRYGPISHEINGDPEVWAFTKEFGERAFRTLIEGLLIIDRNENRWRLAGDWSGNLSRKVRQSPASVRREIEHMISVGWLLVEERAADGSPIVLSAARYADYHRKRKTKNEIVGNEFENKKTQSAVPTILSYPFLDNVSSKEETRARANLVIDNDLGLGDRHPAAFCGWDLWRRLEAFWKLEGKRISLFQIEMLGLRLKEVKDKGKDPVKHVEKALRCGWMDIHELDDDGEPTDGPVMDFDAIRNRAREAAARSRIEGEAKA